MSGAVELEAELRAGNISFAGFSQFHIDMWKDGDFQTNVPGIRAALADAIFKTTALLDTITTLRSDNERLGRELSEARNRGDLFVREAGAHFAKSCELADRALAAEAERDTLLAQVEKMTVALTKIRAMRTQKPNATASAMAAVAGAALTKEPA